MNFKASYAYYLMYFLTSNIIFAAITHSGLVYNNGIIINNRFCTNDPFIFAAGPGTKYSSRYQAPQADHVYCNSLEVGKQVTNYLCN